MHKAISILKKNFKQAGYKFDIPIYAIRYKAFNAFYDPVHNIVAILVDEKIFNKLESDEIAAILAHELGHAYELKKQLPTFIAIYAFELLAVLVTLFNLDFIIKKYDRDFSVKTVESLLYGYLFAVILAYFRDHEIAADAFAIKVNLGEALLSAFGKLNFHRITDEVHEYDVHDIPARRYQAIKEAVEALKYDKESSKLKLK